MTEPSDGHVPTKGELPQSAIVQRRTVRIVGLLAIAAIIYYSLFIVLPSKIDTDAVRASLQSLSPLDLLTLTGAGLLSMLALGWAAKASLPRLSLYRGTESSATSQVTAFVIPPPGDMVIRFAMYRTYGFTDEESAVSVIIAMTARYMAVFFMPIVGLALVTVTGHGSRAELLWLIGLSIAFIGVVVVLLKVVRSDAVAHTVGRRVQKIASRIIRWFRRTPPTDLEDSVVRFGQRMRGTVDTNMRQIVAANVTWGFTNVLVMGLAIRYSGLTSGSLSATEIVLVTGAAMALNSIPIPGGFGITETVLLAMIAFPTGQEESLFTAALLLYRTFTWLLPFPVGGLFFFAWRWRVRRHTQDPDNVAGLTT